MNNSAVASNPGQAHEICLNADELTRLWRPEDLDITKRQHERLTDLRNFLNRIDGNSLASLLVGNPATEISPQCIKELSARTMGRFKPPSAGVEVMSLLVKIIARGNQEGIFVVCPPPIPSLLKKTPSPFRTDHWRAAEVAQTLRSILADAIQGAQRAPHADTRIAFGQILLSAMVHGGLIASASLVALLETLCSTKPPLENLGNRLFLELSMSHKRQEDAEFRRWFADPLSCMLIMRLAKMDVACVGSSAGVNGDDVKSCIRAFLKATGKAEEVPHSLSAMLSAVQLDFQTHIPMYLTEYAARSFVSHSLKPKAYRRLHGCEVPDDVVHRAERSSPPELPLPGDDLAADAMVQADVEPQWMRPLRLAMKGEDRLHIVHALEHLLPPADEKCAHLEVGQLFAWFAWYLFSSTSGAVVTTRAYVSAVGLRLGGLIGHEIPGFFKEEWSALYAEVLSDAETPHIRRKLVLVLRKFQYFLEHEHGAEKMELSEVFGSRDGVVPVDANVISELEFLRVRSRFSDGITTALLSLSRGQYPARLADLAWLVLTLAYRCGLRRMEVLKLDLNDLQFDGRAELLVRPTAARRLKTISSTRKLPLYALLTPEELARLQQFWNARCEEEQNSPFSDFLFAVPARGFTFVPQDTLFKLLHHVMREVTGDQTLRFHHLRHSFASRIYIQLAIEKATVDAVGSTLPGYEISAEMVAALRAHLFGNQHLTRRIPWALCSLMGHSAPDVSFEHYIHHLDILLAEALKQEDIAPSFKTVIAASGTSQSAAYDYCKNASIDAWIAHLHKKQERASLAMQPTSPKKFKLPKPAKSDDNNRVLDLDVLEQIWEQLRGIETSGLPLDEISSRIGVDASLLDKYLRNARWLFSIKTSEQSTGPRHRFAEWVPDKRLPHVKVQIACPTKPHETTDIEVSRALTGRFREVFLLNKDLMREVISYYAQHARTDFGGLIFTDHNNSTDAQKFLQFLKLLGCEIEFVKFDTTTGRSPHAAAWRKALGLRGTLQKKSPPNGKKNWACPWLGIQPVFADAQGKKTGSAGFRFFMVMSLIAWRIP